jgi:hypothetical protein
VIGTANFAYVPDDRLHIVKAGDRLIIGETGDPDAEGALLTETLCELWGRTTHGMNRETKR